MEGTFIVRRFILTSTVFLLAVSTVQAEDSKWGVVDLDRVLEKYTFVETVFGRLEKEYESQQQVLDAQAEEINRLDREVRLKDELASESKKEDLAAKEEALKAQTLDYFRQGREMSEKLEKKKSFHINRILDYVGQAVKEFAKEEGYQLVFKRKFLAYSDAGSENDITDAVVEKLNSMETPDLGAMEKEFDELLKREEERLGLQQNLPAIE